MSAGVTFQTACRLSKKLKKQHKFVVWTSGCFDILHTGHVNFFTRVHKWAGPDAVLFVGVETDAYLKKRKGSLRPIFPQKSRIELLSSLRSVDYVVRLSERDVNETVAAKRLISLKPNAYVRGNSEKRIIRNDTKISRQLGIQYKAIRDRRRTFSVSRIARKILSPLSS